MSEELEGFEELRDPLLSVKGVTPELAEALRAAGYYTVESIAVEVPHFLVERVGEKAGLNVEKAGEIIRAARASLKIRVMDALQLYEEEKKRKTVSTGSKALDSILGGGVHTHELTEVVGPYASGKSEIVYTSAVLATRTLGNVFIIDTEATLNATRILQIAKNRGFNVEELKGKITVYKAKSSSDLVFILENAHKIIKERAVKYLCIDSFVAPFRREYPGREYLAPRQQKLNYCIGMLLKYAEAYEMAVLVTNQVLATPQVQYTTRPELLNPPIGGHVVSHGVNNRLYVQSTSNPYVWLATLIDSSYLPRATVRFKITERGVEDVPDEKLGKGSICPKEGKFNVNMNRVHVEG